MSGINRRHLLAGAATLIATAALAPAQAAAPRAGQQAPSFYRRKVGSFEVTAIYDGAWLRTIDATFVRNAPYADVQAALAASFQAPNTLTIPFTSLAVNTGSKL